MPFFVAVLSFKRKILYASGSCGSFLKNDDSGKAALASLEEDATATEETQEKVSFGSLFLDQVLPKSKRKQHAMSYQQSGRRMNTLVNSYGPFAFVACQTSALM